MASGPNSASPHHEPGDRVIEPGEPLLLDIGGRRAGYNSDITRTVWIADDGEPGPDDTFRHIYELTAAGHDVLAHKPDLVIVEFAPAPSEANSDAIQRSAEAA